MAGDACSMIAKAATANPKWMVGFM